MKATLIKQLVIIEVITALIIFSFPSCAKIDMPECEEWEVTDVKQPTGSCIDWSCTGSRTFKLTFCGSGLKDAKAGNTIIISEDQCCKKTRTFRYFIRKI